ncbi:MAG: 4-amino-4-deoxy-L-arabinose transferase-like glycosyltransferase [Planctomycetota bacterium]|jgi:4-amino-4-deoxy-L-arabinose transferase-like glycosyltransferase
MDQEAQQARRIRLAATLLLALLAGLLAHSAWRVGPTFDEHYYISSGIRYLEGDGFALNREHPPLLKMLMAAPIWIFWKIGLLDVVMPSHAATMIGYPNAFIFQLNAGSVDLLFFLARLPMVCLALLLVVALWRKAHALFGAQAGLAAILLGGFNPNLLAHGPLATLDHGVTVLIFLAILSFVELLEKPGRQSALKTGVLFGLANLAKSTALLLGPGMLAIAIISAVRSRSLKPVLWTLVVWFAGLGVFSAGYGFEARSINEAWGSGPYIADLMQSEYLSDRNQHAVSTDIRSDLGQAFESGDDEAIASAYLRFEELGAAPENLRKSAARVVLMSSSEKFAVERMQALEALTWRSCETLDDWREWHTKYESANWDRRIFTQPLIRNTLLSVFGVSRPIPLITSLKGLDYQFHHAKNGHPSYYAGTLLPSPKDFADGNPFPQFYSHILAIKNPLPFLALFLCGLVMALRRKCGWSALRLVAFVGFPMLLFYTFSVSKMLMGVRYVLPVIPFMALIGASFAKVKPRLTLGLASLSALLAVAAHPHELMYYNLAAGGSDLREGGPRISIVGDDWGQGVRAMGRYYEANKQEIEALGGLHYTPYTAAGPIAFGLAGVKPVQGRVEGIVAVHAVNYWRDCARSKANKKRDYAWLDEFEPFAVIDNSVYLFDTRRRAGGKKPGK